MSPAAVGIHPLQAARESVAEFQQVGLNGQNSMNSRLRETLCSIREAIVFLSERDTIGSLVHKQNRLKAGCNDK